MKPTAWKQIRDSIEEVEQEIEEILVSLSNGSVSFDEYCDTQDRLQVRLVSLREEEFDCFFEFVQSV